MITPRISNEGITIVMRHMGEIYMPTKKPVIQVVLTDKYNKKLKALAKQEDKSTSSYTAKILEQHIDEYEKTHGKIKPENNA